MNCLTEFVCVIALGGALAGGCTSVPVNSVVIPSPDGGHIGVFTEIRSYMSLWSESPLRSKAILTILRRAGSAFVRVEDCDLTGWRGRYFARTCDLLWNPSGDRIAFRAGRDLYILDPSSGGRQRLTRFDSGQAVSSFLWLDNDTICCVTRRSSRFDDEGNLSYEKSFEGTEVYRLSLQSNTKDLLWRDMTSKGRCLFRTVSQPWEELTADGRYLFYYAQSEVRCVDLTNGSVVLAKGIDGELSGMWIDGAGSRVIIATRRPLAGSGHVYVLRLQQSEIEEVTHWIADLTTEEYIGCRSQWLSQGSLFHLTTGSKDWLLNLETKGAICVQDALGQARGDYPCVLSCARSSDLLLLRGSGGGKLLIMEFAAEDGGIQLHNPRTIMERTEGVFWLPNGQDIGTYADFNTVRVLRVR